MSFIDTDNFIVPGNTKVSRNYYFDPTGGFVSISEIDVFEIVAVVNLTRSRILYNPTETGLGGEKIGHQAINLTLDTTGMSKDDVLLVVYVPNVVEDPLIDILTNIHQELQNQTKILNKIYK